MNITDYSDLTICIPAYNEDMSIAGVLSQLCESFPGAEIIVVDDGSTDSTGEKTQEFENVSLISHSHNRGYGASLKTAMRKAGGRYWAWYDADGQHSPEDLIRVCRSVISGENEAIIGVRGKKSHTIAGRSIGKTIFKFVVRILTKTNVPDLNSGMRCFDRNVILPYLHLLPNGFSASTTSTLILLKRGYKVGYVEITSNKREGKSTLSVFRDGWNTLHLILRTLVLFSAFSFFSLLAGLQMMFGVFYGLTMAFTTGRGVPILAATVVISGVITFLAGIICDQVVALRIENLENWKNRNI